jgi:hypothetical protein
MIPGERRARIRRVVFLSVKGVELLLWMLMVVLDGHDDRAFHHSSHTIQ